MMMMTRMTMISRTELGPACFHVKDNDKLEDCNNDNSSFGNFDRFSDFDDFDDFHGFGDFEILIILTISMILIIQTSIGSFLNSSSIPSPWKM